MAHSDSFLSYSFFTIDFNHSHYVDTIKRLILISTRTIHTKSSITYVPNFCNHETYNHHYCLRNLSFLWSTIAYGMKLTFSKENLA